MNEADLYYNVVQSLVKYIKDFQTSIPGSAYVDWDEHANISELPDNNLLIGMAGVGLTEDAPGFYEVVFSFGIATYNDLHLFNLRRHISTLFGKLKTDARIPVYDAETAQEISWMVVKSPRAITPVTKAEIRSLQFVELTASLDPGAASSLR